MKIFHCGHCDQLLFFENTFCVHCGRKLAYLPDRTDVGALEPVGGDRWRALSPGRGEREYRLCPNYTTQNVCNWAVAADDPVAFCLSCRVTRVIPDQNRPGRELWAALEAAKRRMVYSLLCLELPIAGKAEDPGDGLAFEFLADPDPPDAPRVLTGHEEGVITINVAEADDAERELRRHAMKEGVSDPAGPLPARDRPLLLGPAGQGLAAPRRLPPPLRRRAPATTPRPSSAHYQRGAPAGLVRTRSSRPTPARTPGKTGPRPGPTTST